MSRLEQLINDLPPHLHQQAEEYLVSLLAPQIRKKDTPIQFRWAGALSHLRDKYTSLELQKTAWEFVENEALGRHECVDRSTSAAEPGERGKALPRKL